MLHFHYGGNMEDILRMENITKVYPNGVMANKNINFNVRPGEIHALMGENGAGKSTLMKILFGLEKPDEGAIVYKGEKLNISSPAYAIGKGIGMVSQHFMLVDDLKVYENVILGMEPVKGLFIDTDKAVALVEEFGNKFNLRIDPDALVEDLSVSQKQKIEILKVLARGSELIILDEPTAVLTPQETEELFQQLILLKGSGYTIVFITHKIQEVMAICDRITVLRKGRTIDTIDVAGASPESISKLMVGRDILLDVAKTPKEPGDVVLEVKNLTVHNESGVKVVDKVSLTLRQGQILGIAGVEGNGQSDLADAIFGMEAATDGEISLRGKTITGSSIKVRRALGLGYIPEDRIVTGTAARLAIWENLIADKTDRNDFGNTGILNQGVIARQSSDLIKKYNITATDESQPVGMLSGGNIQKVVVARELSSLPSILLANQPTRGIDVGAQEFIWQELIRFRDMGNAVLLISADLNELLELSDVVLVMLNGQIAAEFTDVEHLTEEELGFYMLGVKRQAGENYHEN